MCGIAGIVHPDPDHVVYRRVLEDMCDAIEHRGPDDFGMHFEGGLALGHRRLSIIDLSPAGHQPMCNEDGSIWTVFNGEIYNFEELREELLRKGHQFRSHSDTEVIVHLYEEEGAACVERLEGMFAIAIWDSPARRLVLARDRFGKKPLKYAEINGGIVFASELKAILASKLVSAQADLGDIDAYLSFGYVPAPGTGVRGIAKLPPAHFLVWEDGETRIERYWSIDYRQKQILSPVEWKERVRAAVRDAVARRMVADVPLGAFLSGGMDSSIVVACMAELSANPIETFSIGFEHESYNELPHARAVAEWCGTSHHEFTVRADDSTVLPQLARLYEEPFADASALPTYFLSRETRRHVTVALSGDGGDEIFFGYRRYLRFMDLSRKAALPSRIPGLRSLLRAFAAGGRPPRWARRADFAAGMLERELGSRYMWLIRQSSEREKQALDRGPLRAARKARMEDLVNGWTNDPRAGDSLEDRICFADIEGYLPGQVLPKVDIATMAHSLESRAPLLDHKVAELAASAPASVRNGSRHPKHLLREAFSEQLPPGHFDRPKMGFGIPLDAWFRGPWSGMARDYLTSRDSRVGEYLKLATLDSMIDEQIAGSINHGHPLWSLLMLELWHREILG